MPIYEYQCGGCGYAYSEVKSMSLRADSDCPSCRCTGILQLSAFNIPPPLRVYSRGDQAGFQSVGLAGTQTDRGADSEKAYQKHRADVLKARGS